MGHSWVPQNPKTNVCGRRRQDRDIAELGRSKSSSLQVQESERSVRDDESFVEPRLPIACECLQRWLGLARSHRPILIHSRLESAVKEEQQLLLSRRREGDWSLEERNFSLIFLRSCQSGEWKCSFRASRKFSTCRWRAKDTRWYAWRETKTAWWSRSTPR